jgi:outer membrane protein
MNLPSYYQLTIADDGIKSADYGIEIARQDLITRLVDAYVMFLKAKADEKLYRDELSRVGRVLDQAEAFLKAGTGDVIAVYEAKARRDSAAADLIKTEGALKLAQQNLSILSGIKVDAVRDITVPGPTGPQPLEQEWWLETMMQNHPALLQARTDLRQAEGGTVAARAGHYPTLDGNGGYTVDKGSTFLPKVETSQWYVGGRINVPIYSGGETNARIRSALADEAERRAMRDDLEERATRRLKEAYVTLQYNVSLATAYQRKYESAELQLKAIRKGREIGTRSAIDLLNAEQGYALSQRDLSSALYENVQRRLELKAAAGILAENDLLEISGLPAPGDAVAKP